MAEETKNILYIQNKTYKNLPPTNPTPKSKEKEKVNQEIEFSESKKVRSQPLMEGPREGRELPGRGLRQEDCCAAGPSEKPVRARGMRVTPVINRPPDVSTAVDKSFGGERTK